MRQNREIARVNSIQSIRIRGLESEVSRLLTENVTLREQVISLSQGSHRFEAGSFLIEGVNDIKTKLDDKLAEMNNLLVDLGNLPREFDATNRQHAGQVSGPSITGPNHRIRPSEYNDIIADGRLPVIHEDKVYSGNTLE